MINFKKIGIMTITAFTSFAFMGAVNAESYWYVSDFEGDNGELVARGSYACATQEEPNRQCNYENRPSVQVSYDLNGKGKNTEINLNQWYEVDKGENKNTKFSMTIKGNDLDADKKYNVIYDMSGDNVHSEKEYTGSELNAGIKYSVDKGYGNATVILKDSKGNVLDYGYQTYDCNMGQCQEVVKKFNNLVLRFSNYYKKLVEVFNSVVKDGTIKINAVEPTNYVDSESVVTTALEGLFPADYWVYGAVDDDGTGVVNLSYGEWDDDDYMTQTFEVKYVFLKPDENNMKRVDEVAKKLTEARGTAKDYIKSGFVLEDLELINYLYNTSKTPKVLENRMPNYSSKIHELVDYEAIDFAYDPRAGLDQKFYSGCFGGMNISYKGVIYKTVNPVGFLMKNIIYISDDISKDRDSFIKAAQERIKSYLKNADVKIVYGGKLADVDEEEYKFMEYSMDSPTPTPIDLFDLNKTLGEWYKITIDDKEYSFIIVQDSSKMNEPYVKTVDTETNIYITTGSFDAPLDASIRANKLDENSAEYKQLASKLNIIKGLAYDLKLYSGSLNMYVTKLDDGSFKVYIPVDEEIAKKNLVAVYVKEDGTIEKHPITIENGYAVFETNHFSTYAIVEEDSVPNTIDNIAIYFILFTISIIGLGMIIKTGVKIN